MDTIEKIKKAYIEYFLESDKKPSSVYLLCKKAKIKEDEFYEHFNSTEGIDQKIWLDFFEETRHKIEQDEVYSGYSVREKVLAFYYTLVEVLKAERSFVLMCYEGLPRMAPQPPFLKELKPVFHEFIENLIMEGRETQEIAERPALLMDNYSRIFWWQLLLVTRFWVNDTSKSFEKTDVYIEKAVNFAFDTMGKTSLDSAFDFAKFAFQNR
ncbi:MAG: TetR family transcriptional regulator C-terminal domain-containing protein [Microscillaceae bacterium]|nr:TetR family transcriptional regulator C-terminal domain-containing protein [Microscillaceae bacterium]